MFRAQGIARCFCRRYFSVTPEVNTLKTTPLHDFHVSHGGRMVPFAGWSMPSVYGDLSIVQSVLHTRKYLSLFDVSHMMQMEVSGADAERFLETVLVSDLQSLKKGRGTLSLITNDQGGIVDDCIITRIDSNCFYVVANAACADKDKRYLTEKLDGFKDGSSDVVMSTLKDRALIALQGPMLTSVMKGATNYDMRSLYFMSSAIINVYGIEGCRVTRCGYTGEDGIEISLPSSRAVDLCENLLLNSEVRLAGLGSRDILRTEAGLCLYGKEISEDISPIEAGLVWCIGRRRRRDGGFAGSNLISDQIINGVTRKRVGLISQGPVLREECKITISKDSHITSGCPSPTLGSNIAMAYVPKEVGVVGSEIDVNVRNKIVKAKVCKLPFVPCTYYHK